MLFIYGKLRADISAIVDTLRKHFYDIEIKEDVFSDCNKMNPLAAQSLRWVLWDEKFKAFEYLYFIDADILYIREPVALHEQHIRHMNYINDDGISNIVRKLAKWSNFLRIYFTCYKLGGFKSVLYYLMNLHKDVYRMSGLHFVKIREYYSKITPELLNKYQQIIYEGDIFKNTKFPNDEALLYNMIKESGWEMCHFATQRTSVSMFGFDEPEKREFRPHHGIHLGIFRRDIDKLPEFAIGQLESDDYRYYIRYFEEYYLKDPFFLEMYKSLSDNIKLYFNRMFRYYKIKW
jgi:hypothetical protein